MPPLFCRFLVFVDDHTAVYVGLPLLHLVCRPCKFALFFFSQILSFLTEENYNATAVCEYEHILSGSGYRFSLMKYFYTSLLSNPLLHKSTAKIFSF